MTNQDTSQPKPCTCVGGPFTANAMHFPYCELMLQGASAQPPEEPLVTALHAHIKEVAARPIDVRMLIELERTCLLAREMMAVGKMPNAMSKHRMIQPYNPNVYGGSDDGYQMPIPMGGGFGAMQAISSPNETFGVTAIRELVAGLAALNQKDDSPIVKELKGTIDRLEIELLKARKDEQPAIEAIGAAS
jgi:hypothetical protein